MTHPPRRRRWSQADNDLFRTMVDERRPMEILATTFGMTPAQMRRRGYDIGLPLKWYAGYPRENRAPPDRAKA